MCCKEHMMSACLQQILNTFKLFSVRIDDIKE